MLSQAWGQGNRGRETGHCLLSASVCQRTNRFICVATSDERVAQLVERPAKKPFAILTRVRVPCEARDFAPKVSFECKPIFCVRTDPVCNHMHIVCAHVNSPKLWHHTIVWTQENTAHTGRTLQCSSCGCCVLPR